MCVSNNQEHTPTGQVAYEVHTAGNLLERVNLEISQELGVLFDGVWLLVVHWKAVGVPLQVSKLLGLVRRLNTFIRKREAVV